MFVLLLSMALARTLSGVSLPDSVSAGGQSLVLNGMGLREKYFIDIYVGGLYLSAPSHDPSVILSPDTPKRVVMHFIYSKVTRDQIIASFQEDFGKQPGMAAQQGNVDKLIAVLPAAVVAGDELAFTYLPGVGTQYSLNDKVLVTIPGSDFMKLVFGIFVGANPPTEALKVGLLGG